MPHLSFSFSLNTLLLCYLIMLVGKNEMTTTTNGGKSLVILIAMRMRRYDVGHIAWWNTSRASFKATRCRNEKNDQRIWMKHTKH